MPATPSNIINTDLDIGGDFFASGSIGSSGDMASTGNIFAADSVGLLTANLSSYRINAVESGVVNVDAGATATGIVFPAGSVPTGALVVGAALRVITQIVVDSLTMTFAVNPNGGPDTLIAFTKLAGQSYAAGLTGTVVTNPGITIGSGVGPPPDPDFAGLLFSGGATNTPAAGGQFRVVLYVATVTPPLS